MKKYIKKNDLLPLVEQHFHEYLTNSEYEVQFKSAEELLTWNRLDLAFKLLYLEYQTSCPTFAQEVYHQHIQALTLGSFKEPGNLGKNSFDKFLAEFKKISNAISVSGFDHKLTLIPLASSGSIANGAHRVASAIKANKDIACVKIEADMHQYDYKFFYDRNVSSAYIEAAVSKFIEIAPNVYLALVWPSAVGRDDELVKIIPNIIYRKEINLTGIGAKNLLVNVYHSEPWLGNYENKFKGVQGKLVECFKTTNSLRAIAFQADTHEEVLSIKEKVRNIFQIGKHSIHITDTESEALIVSRLLFNDNSIHFLNYADPYKYIQNSSEIKKIHRFAKDCALKADELLIDGSLLLSLYGIRKNQDVDYLTVREINQDTLLIPSINNHSEDAHYHEEDISTLVINPKFHFYHEGIKFISFIQLYKMKKNRGELKDINDCKMMDSLIDNKRSKILFNKIRQNIFYLKVKAKIRFIYLLKKIRIYNTLKMVARYKSND